MPGGAADQLTRRTEARRLRGREGPGFAVAPAPPEHEEGGRGLT